jgi:hypothetical protein
MTIDWPELIVGTVFGMALSEGWNRYASRRRLDIEPSTSFGDGPDGYVFTIRNRGKTDLPPYSVVIHSSARGSLDIFDDDGEGPLVPNAERRHTLLVGARVGDEKHLAAWFAHHDPAVTDPRRLSTYAFQLVMQEGRRILYRNVRIGTALMRLVEHQVKHGEPLHTSWSEWKQLRSLTVGTWLRRQLELWQLNREVKRRRKVEASAATEGKKEPPQRAGVGP